MSDEMTPEQIDAFLAAPRIAAFATVDAAGKPRIRPVWYLWRDGGFWLTTRLHRHTGRDLQANPAAALSVASEDRPYRSVVAYGTPEVHEKDERLLLDIATRYGEDQGRSFVAEAIAQSDRVLLRFVPAELISWDYGTTS
jgi:PPOX class probable F420-dependent enzyme